MTATLEATTDPYRSRVAAEWEATARVDPVVWSSDRSAGPLQQAQLTAYEHDGYQLATELFTAVETTALLHEAQRLAAEAQPGTGVIIEPGSQEVRSLFRLHETS